MQSWYVKRVMYLWDVGNHLSAVLEGNWLYVVFSVQSSCWTKQEVLSKDQG